MKLKFLISFGRVQKNKRTESIIKKRQIYKKQSIIEKQREREWGGYKIKCAASSDFKDELISIVVKIIHKFFLLILSTVL